MFFEISLIRRYHVLLYYLILLYRVRDYVLDDSGIILSKITSFCAKCQQLLHLLDTYLCNVSGFALNIVYILSNGLRVFHSAVHLLLCLLDLLRSNLLPSCIFLFRPQASSSDFLRFKPPNIRPKMLIQTTWSSRSTDGTVILDTNSRFLQIPAQPHRSYWIST